MAESMAQPVSTANRVNSVDLVKSVMTGNSGTKVPLPDLGIPSTKSSIDPSDRYLDESQLVKIEPNSRVQEQVSKPAEESKPQAELQGSTEENTESDSTEVEPQPNLDVEIIKVPSKSGKGKVDIELNFSDRDSIKKLVTDRYNFENGFRKVTAERDQLLKSKEANDRVISSFKALDEAYQSQGPQGVIDLLEADNGGYTKWLDKEIEKREFRKYASPEELKAIEAQETAAKYRLELDKKNKELESLKSGKGKIDEEAEIKAINTEIAPIRDKYSFKGKLGDAEDEKLFDKMVWNEVMDNLNEEYGSDENTEVELADIEAQFKLVSSKIRNRLQKQTEQKVNKVIEQKKREATENAQASIKSEYNNQDMALRDEANKMLTGGNLTGLISGWKKYGNLFGSK